MGLFYANCMTKKFDRIAPRKCNQKLVDVLIAWGALLIWLMMTYALGSADVWAGLKCFNAWPDRIVCAVVMIAPFLACLLFWTLICRKLINFGYWVHVKRMKKLRRQGKQVSILGF